MHRLLFRSRLVGVLLMVVVLAAACTNLPVVSGGTPVSGPPAAGTPDSGAATPTPPVPGSPVPGSAQVVEAARAALAQQLGVKAEDIKVVSSGQVDWPNGCLGIEKPGIMCTDAIVPGYQVILEANGKQYEMRTDLSGQTVAVAPEGASGGQGEAALRTRERAAADLGGELGAITIVSAERTEWPDACLGMPDPAELCGQVITPGYRVTVELNGRQYVYRTDDTGQRIRRERQAQSPGEFPAAAQAARDALAKELGVPVESINIQRADATEFTDGCLGLGGPAESCLQAITPGYTVFLERNGEQYVYHTDQSGQNVRRATSTASELPAAAAAAAQAAREALAKALGVPLEKITVAKADPFEFTDACLGLGGAAESCLQAITPGYKVTLDFGGQTFVYHTDQSGQNVRRNEAAETPAGSASDQTGGAVIGLRRDVNGSCTDVRIDLQGVSFGACGLEMVASGFVTTTNRLEQLADMQRVYQSFGASTAAGKVTFAGQGPIAASPVEQRMIAEWANLVALETRSGTRIAMYGLEWHREGGIAGFCDDIRIDSGGHATWQSCKQGPADAQLAGTWRRLTSEELTQFYGWIDTLGAVQAEQKDPATADAMTTRASLAGRGTADAAQGDKDGMLQFGALLLQQWADATPARFLSTSAEVNIRKGPGETFDVVGTIAAGQQALVTGVSRDGGWWRVVCPDDTVGNCWVSNDSNLVQPIAPAGSTGLQPGAAGQPAIDETQILAAVIRRIYTVDDTFGGASKLPMVYLLSVDDANGSAIPYASTARPLAASVQQGVVAALSDLNAQFKWVTNAGEVQRDKNNNIAGGAGIITVGQVRTQPDGAVRVTSSIYLGPLAAGGQTYILANQGGQWQVTGTTGAQWIS